MMVIHQYLVRNRNTKEVTHGIWVLKIAPNRYKLSSNLPNSFLYNFFETQNLKDYIYEYDSVFRLFTRFIRFIEGKDLTIYEYPAWMPNDLRKNGVEIDLLKLWLYHSDIKVASNGYNQEAFWGFKTEIEGVKQFFGDIFEAQTTELTRSEFEAQLITFKQREEYVHNYKESDSFFSSKEDFYTLYFACNENIPVLFLMNADL